MNTKIIAAEFRKSMLKAIEKYATKYNVGKINTQIVIKVTTELRYEVLVGYDLKERVALRDILFINPIYSMFKGKIEEWLLKCINAVAEKEKSKASFISTESKVNPGQLRLMLYTNGEYRKDITEADIVNYSN